MHFQIANTVDALAEFLDQLQKVPGYDGLPEERVFSLRLVIEELLSNIVKYSDARTMEISISITADRVSARIRDDGSAFDPFREIKKTEITETIEDQQIGGLGVFLVTQLASDYCYRREDETNIVFFTIGDKQL